MPFFYPWLLNVTILSAIFVLIIHETQCPATVNGFTYYLYGCGTFRPVYLCLFTSAVWQILTAWVANRFFPEVRTDPRCFFLFFWFLVDASPSSSSSSQARTHPSPSSLPPKATIVPEEEEKEQLIP
jgi:hypothetical protein